MKNSTLKYLKIYLALAGCILFGSFQGSSSFAQSTVICSGDSAYLTLSGYTGTIQWQESISGIAFTNIAGATNDTLGLTGAATSYYRAAVTDGNCQPAYSDTALITVNPKPMADAGADAAICTGNSSVIGGSPTATGGTAPYTFMWTPAGDLNNASIANPTASPTSTTTYSVTVTDANGCMSTDFMVLTVNPLPVATITPGGPTTFCGGNSVVLTSSTGSAYLWSNGATTLSITVTTSGSYTVTVTDANGCSTTSAATTVTVNDPTPAAPTSSAGTSITCTGFTANWTASAGATDYYLDVATDGGFTAFVAGYNDLNVGNVLSTNVTGLAGATAYYYRVRAGNPCGTSSSSGTTIVTTSSPVPTAPIASAATAVTTTSLTANWAASAGATTYYLDVATDVGYTAFVAGFNNMNTGNVTSTSVTGLTCNTTYYYRVMASNACGTSANSNSITTTPSCSGSMTFTSSGTFTVPAGITSVRVLVVGGGGGGANGHQGGGGSGNVGTGTYTVTPGSNITVTVGTGGNGAVACNGCNNITGNTAGTSSSFVGFLSSNGGLTPTTINGPGANGGSGGGGSCNAGSSGGAGGSGGLNGGACTYQGGTGQGSYTASLSLFTVNTITAGAGGAGGNSSHAGGGGGGGVRINAGGPTAGSGPQVWSGKGGVGYGGGGGGGGYDSCCTNREPGGNGAAGVVYVEW